MKFSKECPRLGDAAIAGGAIGVAAAFITLVLFGGDCIYDDEGHCSVAIPGEQFLLIPVVSVAGIVSGAFYALALRVIYRTKLWWWSRRLNRQGWRTSAEQLRRFARNPAKWERGITLDIPHP